MILRYHFSASDVHAVQAVVARLHRAVSEGDVDTAVSCYAESYFRISRPPGATAGDPTGWTAGPVNSRDEIRQALSGLSTYVNDVEFLHTNLNGNAAVVVTKETGSASQPDGNSGSWEDITNLWYLTKGPDGWQLTSSVHHVGAGD